MGNQSRFQPFAIEGEKIMNICHLRLIRLNLGF